MINKLERHNLNCNVFSAYDFQGLSMQELLCEFFTKINECIDVGNESLNILEWLKDIGLPTEVIKQLEVWLSDGTLEGVINEGIFTNLNDKINNVKSRIVSVSDFGAVGDGVTNDAPSILNAMLSLRNSPVKILHFEPGKTYKIDDGLEMNVDGITLEGNGATITSDSDTIGNMLINGVIGGQYHGYNGNSNITVNNLIFRGNSRGTSNCAIAFGHAKNIKITNCEFYDIYSHCLDMAGIDGLFIDNCKFMGSPTSDTNLRECIQLDYNSSPGFTVFGSFDKTVTKNVVITNCEIGASTTFPSWERGVGAHTSFIENIFENVTIDNNIIDVVTSGISFNGTNVSNLKVTNNTINVSATNGTSLLISADKRYCLPSENITFNNNICVSDYGVSFNSDVETNALIIKSNNLKCKNTGMRIQSYSYSLKGATIDGNVIDNLTTGIGIKLIDMVDVNLLNNNIKNSNYTSLEMTNCNTCNVSGNTISYGFKYGILSDKMSNTVIQNNFIDNMSSSAIVVNYSSTGDYKNNKVLNNTVTNIGYYGTPGLQNRGIQVDNTTLLNINGNVVSNINSLGNYIVVGNNVNGVVSSNVLLSNESSPPTLSVTSKVHNVNNSLLAKL